MTTRVWAGITKTEKTVSEQVFCVIVFPLFCFSVRGW